jgi:hypothetical protein
VGTVTYGHVTGVLEDNAETFLAEVQDTTGEISGSGDAETLTLDPGEYAEFRMVNVGTIEIEILYDNYQSGSGPAPTIKYKDGDSEANCNADTWNTYSVPFTSAGYVKIRFEV